MCSFCLPGVGSVDSHFVNLGRVFSQVLDVAEHMAAAVLADEVSQVSAKTHVCNGGLVIAPFLYGKALE